MIKRVLAWFNRLLFREEGGKKVLNRKNTALLGVLVVVIGVVATLIPAMFANNTPSEIKKSDVPLVKDGTPTPTASPQGANSMGGIADHAPNDPKVAHGKSTVRYKAKQVILPTDGGDKIPMGSNLIGKLLSAVDTRSTQEVQVILPYGAAPKSGGGSLPPETVLFGQASYSGHSDRVYLNFDRGILPDGGEISLKASALSSKDYSPGVIGDFHGNTTKRMASVLGLSMVSGMSDVMVEKESLGQSFMPTAKSSLKNGFYNGLSKVSEMAASEQAEKLSQTPEYVTLDAGMDLIVSLVSSYHPNDGHQ